MNVPSWLPLLLGFLTAVGPVSTDMYLPAFPAIERSLGGEPGAAQITLAAWFAGLAVGQITLGSLSDRFGRRWPLIGGTIVYALASAGCALAPDLTSLSVFRAIAAIGGSASMVIPRAIVRDLADGHAAARLLSKLMLVMGAAPILAPSLGGAMLGFAGWHAIFWVCALYGLLGGVLVVFLLPDTLPPQMRVRLGLAGLLGRYAAIARERSFLAHASIGGFSMFGMFAYIGGSPAFITMFGISPALYGILFSTAAGGYILASQMNARILPRFGHARVLATAIRVYMLATLVLAVNAMGGFFGLPGLFLPILVAMSSMGFVMPNATVGALSRHAAHAASASALMGTMQFILAALAGTLVGVLADDTARPLALLMVLGAAGGLLADIGRARIS
jgi:DHA1 family bicyclomycin/chloramphenicol resistance-like MFS transporter